MKTQISVDWLAEQMHELVKSLVKKEINLAQFTQKRDELLQTARKMHREEVEDAVSLGRNTTIKAKDYYSQTFETP